MAVQELVEIKFRLADGSDIGPNKYSPSSTVGFLKEKIIGQWPKGCSFCWFGIQFSFSSSYIYMLMIWFLDFVWPNNSQLYLKIACILWHRPYSCVNYSLWLFLLLPLFCCKDFSYFLFLHFNLLVENSSLFLPCLCSSLYLLSLYFSLDLKIQICTIADLSRSF